MNLDRERHGRLFLRFRRLGGAFALSLVPHHHHRRRPRSLQRRPRPLLDATDVLSHDDHHAQHGDDTRQRQRGPRLPTSTVDSEHAWSAALRHGLDAWRRAEVSDRSFLLLVRPSQPFAAALQWSRRSPYPRPGIRLSNDDTTTDALTPSPAVSDSMAQRDRPSGRRAAINVPQVV